jgi:hypothetical protein
MSFRKNRDRGDEDVKVSVAKDSKTSKKSTSASAPKAEEKAPEQQDQGEQVPDGTTAEVLAWVGDDKARAQAALDKENADDSPRKGLTGELEQMLGS